MIDKKLVAAITAVLAGFLTLLAANDDMPAAARYGAGAIALAGLLLCAFHLGARRRRA